MTITQTLNAAPRTSLVPAQPHDAAGPPPGVSGAAAPGTRPATPPAHAGTPGAPERGPLSPSVARFVRASATTTPKPFDAEQVKLRIDGVLNRAHHVYDTPEGQVAVPSQFRMSTGFGGAPEQNIKKLLDALPPGSVPVSRIGMVLAGRGTATDIADVTQKLIDNGKLIPPNRDHQTLASRVQGTQWEYHFGVDCAGYVQRAFLSSRGGDPKRFGLHDVLNENLANLKANPCFRKIDVESARVGDLFILDPQPGDRVGHTAIVADHHAATEADVTALPPAARAQARELLGQGDVQAFVVDSSWGSGDQGLGGGGVQRRVWLFSPSMHIWADASPVDAKLNVYDTPYNHPINGVYRPREEG